MQLLIPLLLFLLLSFFFVISFVFFLSSFFVSFFFCETLQRFAGTERSRALERSHHKVKRNHCLIFFFSPFCPGTDTSSWEHRQKLLELIIRLITICLACRTRCTVFKTFLKTLRSFLKEKKKDILFLIYVSLSLFFSRFISLSLSLFANFSSSSYSSSVFLVSSQRFASIFCLLYNSSMKIELIDKVIDKDDSGLFLLFLSLSLFLSCFMNLFKCGYCD